MGRHGAHNPAGLSPAGSPRGLALGVVIALLIGAGVWAVFHARGGDPPMLIVQPAAGLPSPPADLAAHTLTPPTATPTGSPSPSTPPAASPSPSAPRSARSSPATEGGRVPTRGSTRSPAAAPPPAPSRAAPPQPQPQFSARYSVSSDWYNGFVATVDITNRSNTSGGVELRLTYPSDVRITVRQYWGSGDVTARASGRTLIFSSRQPLAPGASLRVGFQADKDTHRRVRPSTCTVNGASCEIL